FDAGVVHLGLQLVGIAERIADRVGERARRIAAAARLHQLPEHRVVDVPAAVVAHGGPLVLGQRVEVRDHLLDWPVGPVGAFERRVQVGDVGLVVFVVVDLHRLRVDRRLQRLVRVGERGQLVGHGVFSFRWSSGGGYARARSMSLAYDHVEIAPRELKPALYELEGISRQAVEAHYRLYQGYVAKRNEILAKLPSVDLAAANQTYSELRALKVEL